MNCSAWTDETSMDVPSAWLSDGGTYYWRVQSADVCTQPDTLCNTTKPDGSVLDWRASGERAFTIGLKNWGEDRRYAMVSQDAGNGMTINVNEANGNMFLEVPIESLRTPLGRLRVGLSYNSQAAAEGNDQGLGDGWRLYAGPESSGMKLPTELTELSPAPYGGVRIRYRSGAADVFPWRANRTYAYAGAASGVVRKSPNGTWLYRGPDGDVFRFDAAGQLTSARPVAGKPKAKAAGFQNSNYRYAPGPSEGVVYSERKNTYDAFGNPLTAIAPHWNGTALSDQATTYTYDSATNRLKRSTDPCRTRRRTTWSSMATICRAVSRR